jgi:uncharacterized protein YndB with AHSA1/START domain
MPEILHRISIDAPASTVHDLVATTDGVGRWWTGRPVEGDAAVGGQFSAFFGDTDTPAAVFQTESDGPDEVVWRVIAGPESWIDTVVTFTLRDEASGGTTLLFTHAGWKHTSEFMSGCSTNWGAYLTSLKQGAEGSDFHPFPEGEISRWS